CAGVPQWNSGDVYTGSNEVTYNGKLWKAKWWTLNNEPGNNQEDVWAELGACDGAPKPTADVGSGVCSGVNSWNPGVAYVGSNQVTYNGNLTTPNPTTSSNPEPTPDTGICTDIPQWNSGVAYTGSQQVIYNGSLWKAKWWTLNNEPGNNPEQVWVEVGSC
ncbi:hypothetical protein K493DRAFT_180712, partial [Basidiobolus meristosporus CBS 931.73]